jgi:hypothetical protein
MKVTGQRAFFLQLTKYQKKTFKCLPAELSNMILDKPQAEIVPDRENFKTHNSEANQILGWTTICKT